MLAALLNYVSSCEEHVFSRLVSMAWLYPVSTAVSSVHTRSFMGTKRLFSQRALWLLKTKIVWNPNNWLAGWLTAGVSDYYPTN